MDCAIQTHGLTKRYGHLTAIDNLDLCIPKGSIFGLVGPNGAGKTTLFGMITRYLKRNSGEIYIMGTSIDSKAPFNGRLRSLPQDAHFPSNLKLWDILLHLSYLIGMDKAHAQEEVKRVLDAVGLLDKANVRYSALSHGMAKRAGIAQAFLGDPDIVLLDEPTNGLDPRSAHQIRQMIQTLKDTDRTIVISSHNLSEIEDLCTHVAILDHGRLVHSGPIDSFVMTNEVILLTLVENNRNIKELLTTLTSVVKVELLSNHRYRVEFKSATKSPEAVISEILKHLIDHGVFVSEVERGVTLEQRFLEVT